MAGHAALRALAEEHCFASNTGLAWRVANDMLRLPEPTMRQHFDDSDTKPYGELRRRDDCPTAPASLIAFVVHPRQRHARLTRLAHGRRPERQPRWARAAAQYQLDYEICPASERSCFVRNVRRIALRLAAFSAYMRTGWGGSDCSALGDTWALGHLFRPEPCPTRTPSAQGTAPRLSRRPVSVPRHNR